MTRYRFFLSVPEMAVTGASVMLDTFCACYKLAMRLMFLVLIKSAYPMDAYLWMGWI